MTFPFLKIPGIRFHFLAVAVFPERLHTLYGKRNFFCQLFCLPSALLSAGCFLILFNVHLLGREDSVFDNGIGKPDKFLGGITHIKLVLVVTQPRCIFPKQIFSASISFNSLAVS